MSKLLKLKNSEYKIVSFLKENQNVRISFTDLQEKLNINAKYIRDIMSGLEANLIVTINRQYYINSYVINPEEDWRMGEL